ncbi:mechanosensitive ion channel domain-containing protein [Rubripirellula obstinata]|nr:mechanosensitive ion channel domain-containing protein [Rubripirellula obstinata]
MRFTSLSIFFATIFLHSFPASGQFAGLPLPVSQPAVSQSAVSQSANLQSANTGASTQQIPAVTDNESTDGNQPTIKSVIDEINVITAAADLADELKKECLDRLGKAKASLESAQASSQERTAIEAELTSLPARTEDVRQQLAKDADALQPEFPEGITIAGLEARLADMRQQVEAADADAQASQKATESRGLRIADLAKQILETDKRLTQTAESIVGITGTDLLSKTKLTEQRCRQISLTKQLEMLKVKQRLMEANSEILPMQRDLAVRNASIAEKQLTLWQDAVSRWRKQESQRQAKQARRIAEQSHPALKSLASQNADIAELRIATAAGIDKLAKMLHDIRESSTRTREQFDDLRDRVEHAGATTSTGILLRKQRSELPQPSTFLKRETLVEQEMPKAHLRLMEMKQWRREVADLGNAAEIVMQNVGDDLADYNRDNVIAVVKRLLSDRRDFLDKVIPDQNTYLRDLNELDLANGALATQVNEFQNFLDQRVLWIRSDDMFGLSDIRDAAKGLRTVIAPSRIAEVAKVGGADMLRRPAVAVAVIAAFFLVMMFRARMVATQTRLTNPPSAGQCASFRDYALACVITLVISVRWPILLAAFGYRLVSASGTTPWTHSVGEALLTTVLFVWSFELIREMSRRGGVGEKLFGWSEGVSASIRGSLETMLLLGTPLFALLQLAQFDETPEMESLKRFLFITLLMLTGFQLGWLARNNGKLMRALVIHAPKALVCRLRRPIGIFATAAPIGFALMSFAGFHFSAYQLSGRLAETGAAIVAMIVLHSLSLCWLEVKGFNRKLRQRKEEQQKKREEMLGASEPIGSPAKLATIDTAAASVIDVSNQSMETSRKQMNEAADQEFKELLRYAAVITLIVGGWFIWSDVLPALRILDKVELWQNIETVAETVIGKDGSESIRTIERNSPTTLTNVLMAFVIGLGTVMVGRRLPGLLELTLLERLPLEPGTRQAIAILVRYTATVTGMLLVCNAIHLSWGSVQWLAAAMTVGLGFGLQEIFANLVSGLIILFERPIRAGDLVTVGDVTGHVTRMQMRATTITDFDRRELIVPNKTFITDSVINWTLSDPVSRITLPVGVAYGTSVARVREIMLTIAENSSSVMSEPPPHVLFKGFGDSTLDVELRVFIPKRELYVDVVNEINLAIADEFSQAGIEIAFPQQDLHIRSIDGLPAMIGQRQEPQREAA